MKAVAIFDPVSSGSHLKQAAKKLGFNVVGVFTQSIDSLANLYRLKDPQSLKDGCDAVVVASTKDEVLKRLQALPFSIQAAIAGTEGSVELAEQVADALHLPCNSIHLSMARRHKGEMRKVLRANGLSCPDFATCKSEEEVIQFAEAHAFPLVIKTPRGAMTSHVYICEDLQSLIVSFYKIYGQGNLYGAQADCAILEEFLSGEEYAVNTFSDGKNIYVTDIWLYEKIEMGSYSNVYYNIISMPFMRPLIEEAIRVVKAFHIDKGPAHLEFKLDPIRGPTLIEIGARLAGVNLPWLVQKFSNCDLFKATIEVFVKGETTITHPIHYSKALAVALFPQENKGEIRAIKGVDQIEKLSSYYLHSLYVQVGDEIEPSTPLSSVPLIAFFANANRDQLLKDLESAHKLFSILT